MVNILRMDLYRLVRSKSLWVCLGITIALAVMTIGILGLATNADFMQWAQASGGSSSGSFISVGINDNAAMSPEEVQQSVSDATAMLSDSTLLVMTGGSLVKGGALALMFSIFLSIFLASEFEGGYSKNVFTVQPNRFAFLGARLVEIVLIAAVFVAVSMLAIGLTSAIAGVELAAVSVADMLLWGGLVTLVLSGYGMLVAFIIWLTRKMAAGIVMASVLVTGLIVMLAQAAFSLFPALSHLTDFTLFSCMQSIGQGLNVEGALSVAHVAGVGLAFVVAFTVFSAVVLKKKDI